MKRLFLACIALMLCLFAKAQPSVGVGYSGETFRDSNVRGGSTIMAPHGGYVSASWRIPVLNLEGHLLSVEPIVRYAFSVASEITITDASQKTESYPSTVYFSDLSLPILISYGYNFADKVMPFVTVGPKLCYNIDTYSVRESIYSGTDTSHIGLQAAVGGGVVLWKHYRIEVLYGFGVTNREFRSKDRNLFPSTIHAGVSYIF